MIQANCCTCIEIATQLQQEVKGFQLHDKKNFIWESTNNQKKPTQSVLFTRQLHLLNIWVMRSETTRFSCTWHLSYEIDILFKMYEYNFIKCALCTAIVKHWQNQNDGTLWPKPEHCTNIQMQIDHRNTKHTHTHQTQSKCTFAHLSLASFGLPVIDFIHHSCMLIWHFNGIAVANKWMR